VNRFESLIGISHWTVELHERTIQTDVDCNNFDTFDCSTSSSSAVTEEVTYSFYQSLCL